MVDACFRSVRRSEKQYEYNDEIFVPRMQEALARNKEEAQILAWLENHVVTDVAYEQTERIVWTALWDDARKMSKEEGARMEGILGERMRGPGKRLLRQASGGGRPHAPQCCLGRW